MDSKDVKGMKVAWAISERNGKSYWTKIGVAFTNRDGSLNLKLECVPVGGGQIQIRDYEPRDEQPVAAATGTSGPPPLPKSNGTRGAKGGPLTDLPF